MIELVQFSSRNHRINDFSEKSIQIISMLLIRSFLPTGIQVVLVRKAIQYTLLL